MKKVNCICLHSNYKKIYNITVITKTGENITLLRYDRKENPYEYKTFKELYKSVLNLLKNNGFYVGKEKMFDTYYYNIQFVNLAFSSEVEKLPYNKVEESKIENSKKSL